VPAGLLFELADEPVPNDAVRAAEQRWRAAHPELLRRPDARARRTDREAWSLLYQWRGAYFAERQMWPEAEEAYALATEWFTRSGDVWHCLANARLHNGRRLAAAAAYERAIREEPRRPGPRTDLAVLCAEAGQTAAAEALLQDELRRSPDYAPARANLDLLHRRK